MKSILKLIPVVILSVLVTVSCKKATPKTTTTAYPNATQHNQDVQNTKTESDNSNNDVNTAVTGSGGFGKNSANEALSICGGTVDTSHSHDAPNPYVIINYDGQTVCPGPNRIRSGSVKIQLVSGAAWTDINAQLLVTYIGYKITYPSLNSAYLIFNGTKLLTDVSGANLLSIYLTGGTIQFRERSYNMTVSFENDSTSSWNDARLSTWLVAPGVSSITATVNGDTTINGKVVDSWGQTRWHTNFTTEMISPWVSGTTCGWWYPTAGEYTSVTDNFTVSAQFGVNSSGNAVTAGCPYGFTLSWTITASNTSGSVVLPYY